MSTLFKPMKWISAISVLFFGWAAAVQLTGDPDKAIWFAIYVAVAMCSLVNLVFRPGKSFAPIPLVVALVALIWGLFLLPEFNLIVDGQVLNLFDESIKHRTEEEREVLGLLLAFLFSGVEVYHSTTTDGTNRDD